MCVILTVICLLFQPNDKIIFMNTCIKKTIQIIFVQILKLNDKHYYHIPNYCGRHYENHEGNGMNEIKNYSGAIPGKGMALFF